MAEFKFRSIQITRIDPVNNLFQVQFDNHSKSFLLDYTAHVNKNDLALYDNVINKQYVFNHKDVKARSNEQEDYISFENGRDMFIYLYNIGFFDVSFDINHKIMPPIQIVYPNPTELFTDQHAQKINFIYEITDANGFGDVTTGKLWVRYKGTTNANETDYQIIGISETELQEVISQSSQNIQQVLEKGNVSSNQNLFIEDGDLLVRDSASLNGNLKGVAIAPGEINIYNSYVESAGKIQANLLNTGQSFELPNQSGTFALTSDLTAIQQAIPTNTNQLINNGSNGTDPFITALDVIDKLVENTAVSGNFNIDLTKKTYWLTMVGATVLGIDATTLPPVGHSVTITMNIKGLQPCDYSAFADSPYPVQGEYNGDDTIWNIFVLETSHIAIGDVRYTLKISE